MTNQVADLQVETLRQDWRTFLSSRPDLGPADVAPYTVLSEIAVRHFLNGHIRGGREVCAEMKRVLGQALAGDVLESRGASRAVALAAAQPTPPERPTRRHAVYETQAVRRVAEVLDYCAQNATIGVITGEFGSGKTEAVRIWRANRGRKVDALVFEFDEFSASSKPDFTVALAALLGIETVPGTHAGGRMFRAVCDRLCEHQLLMIFDQCEAVRTRVVNIIRQLWDRSHESGVGVVILAAPVLMTRMLRSRVDDLGALSSRVGIWEQLPGLTKEEMAAILKAEGVAELDDDAFHLWWQSTNGSMRRLMRSIELLKSKHQDKRITTKTIAGVASKLWGMRARVEAA